jgi:DtxR family Mn-dependent transcriptional regulator
VTGKASAEEYLEALYKLAHAEADLVSTTQVAQMIGVSAASVSEMFRRLSDQGLVDYVPYRGASLTARGRREGARVIRNHRLWERFLVDVLGMEWDKVHAEACRLEHATSPGVAERLAEFLNDPRTCPHGHALPASVSGENTLGAAPAATPLPTLYLSEAPQGFEGQVIAVGEDPELLRHCARVGLTPGARFRVTGLEPLDEILELVLTTPCSAGPARAGEPGSGAPPLTVGPGVASKVLVRRHVE